MRAPDFWGPSPSGAGRLMAAVLGPLGCAYGMITAFRAGRDADWQAPVPVICVGNAVAGGAGKTQIVIDLARRLGGKGLTPHVLTRGYGGSLTGTVRVDPAAHTANDVGDEALLIADFAPIWRSADRVEGAKAAIAAGAGIVIMDDGFQNPSLAKTLSLLVIDGGYGFGNGRPMPAGPLREPATRALARADAVVVIGNAAALDLTPGMPRFDAHVRPAKDAPDLAGRDVVAFAGIGQPQKFFDTLTKAGANLVVTRAFADHHPFSPDEIATLIGTAAQREATPVTTTKDHIRIPADMKSRVTPYPVEIAWDDAAALENFILTRTGLD